MRVRVLLAAVVVLAAMAVQWRSFHEPQDERRCVAAEIDAAEAEQRGIQPAWLLAC